MSQTLILLSSELPVNGTSTLCNTSDKMNTYTLYSIINTKKNSYTPLRLSRIPFFSKGNNNWFEKGVVQEIGKNSMDLLEGNCN